MGTRARPVRPAGQPPARAGAEAALRERDQVLAIVSHDLKTPLTAIRGQADLLQMRLERTDLVVLAWQAAAEQQRTTERHRIRAQTPEAKLIGVWDPVRLGRVLDNLLDNAVKFSPAGGEVVVTVTREADAAGERAVLSVRDQGLGIPAADVPHVFERFRRGTNVAGRIAGTGLGLAEASHIVQLHGGSIGVDSQEQQGSTVTVKLPLPGLIGQPQPGGTETEPPASAA